MPKRDHVWQHSEPVQQRVDANGNWSRLTDAKISDHSSERSVEALGNTGRYQSSSVDIKDHKVPAAQPCSWCVRPAEITHVQAA